MILTGTTCNKIIMLLLKDLILISKTVNIKPTLNTYFKKLFENKTLDWNKISLSTRLATTGCNLRSFQYKIFNNILFLNKNLYTSEITNTALCSFYSTLETPIHIFYDCTRLNLFQRDYGRNILTILSYHEFFPVT